MPRNFDEELIDDRQFTIGGETFSWRYLHWREFAAVMDKEDEESKQREQAQKEAGDGWVDPTTFVGNHEELVESIVLLLDPGQAARFKETVNDPAKEIGFQQIVRLHNWLLNQQTARPTDPPEGSGPSGGATGASSQARSSRQAATPKS